MPLDEDETIYCNCDNCGIEIVNYVGNPEDALIIKFEGGYGCYIDPMDVDCHTAVICFKCAEQLSTLFPNLGKIIERG